MKTCQFLQTRLKQVKASLGGVSIKNLAEITRKLDPIQDIFYLFIFLLDSTKWIMFSPPIHTPMKNHKHLKTYIMYWHFLKIDPQPFSFECPYVYT